MKSPAKYKICILTFLGLLAPVYFIPPWLAGFIPKHPFIVVVIALLLIVPMMVYLLMPTLFKCFEKWLKP